MSLSNSFEERHVLPQWRTPKEAAAHGERSSDSPAKPRQLSPREDMWLQKARREFDQLEISSDLFLNELATGISPASEESRSFYRSKVGQEISRILCAKENTESRKEGNSIDEVRGRIALIKTSLRTTPRSPLDWAELARNYLLVGQRRQAERAMRMSLGIAGPNRYLYRSAVRMYVHLDDLESAHELILAHPNFRADPWLLATEISVCQLMKRTSRFAKHGAILLSGRHHRPNDHSELAATLATLELNSGDIRKAKKLFEQSISTSNENAIAQVEWAHQREKRIPRGPLREVTSEAAVWRSKAEQNWDNVVEGCEAWGEVEPFSSRPPIMGSYYSELALGESTKMADIAKAGLIANPHDSTLLNNYSVALSYLGDVEGALRELELAFTHREQDGLAVLIASLGLIAFRNDDVEIGANYYARAMAEFLEAKDRVSMLMAAVHWLREEARLGSKDVEKWINVISKQAKTLPTHRQNDVNAFMKLIEREQKQSLLVPRSSMRVDSITPKILTLGAKIVSKMPAKYSSVTARQIVATLE